MVCIYNVYQKVNNKLEQPNKGKKSHKRNRRMKDRVATHNTLHAALYTPDKHCTTGFKQIVKDDIIRLLQKEKPACCRDGNFR